MPNRNRRSPSPTMIVMVSPSESSRDETTSHEDFYTLTKGSLPQIDVINSVETMIIDGGCTEAKRAFDLGKDLDNLWRNYIMRYLHHDLLPMLKCLRELRLCSSGLDELTNSIGDLRHLRYLNVSHSQIRKLPKSVVTLYNLQVLFLKFCEKLEKLPINMGNLVNLRHFDMTNAKLSLEKCRYR
ncbi:hypothetical protein ACSBR1_018393 [Camellia fascicularis]